MPPVPDTQAVKAPPNEFMASSGTFKTTRRKLGTVVEGMQMAGKRANS